MKCGIEFVAHLDPRIWNVFNTQHYSIYEFHYYAEGELLPSWDFASDVESTHLRRISNLPFYHGFGCLVRVAGDYGSHFRMSYMLYTNYIRLLLPEIIRLIVD